MTIENFLDVLRIIVSWPIVMFVFLISQRDAIAKLIDRIKQVNLPGGGGIETEPYNPELPSPKDDTIKDTQSQTLETTTKINVFEKDFNYFIFFGLRTNKRIIDNLVNAISQKFLLLLKMTGRKITTPSDKFKILVSE